jgi:hypothetical protein
LRPARSGADAPGELDHDHPANDAGWLDGLRQGGGYDTRPSEAIAGITQELLALGRIRPLPTLAQAKAGLYEILDLRDEPKTYEERRLILDVIIDLHLGYERREFEHHRESADSGGSRKQP